MAKAARAVRWKTEVLDIEEQRRIKERAILREAGRAFGRFGFHNTSLDEVARALHISKPTLYNYFPTKHELLFQCHCLALDLGDRSMSIAREQGKTGLDKIACLVRDYTTHKASELGEFAVLTDFHSLLPEHRKVIQARRDRFDRELRSWVTEGIEDGSIEPCDPTVAVGFFMGAINWLSLWYSPAGAVSAEAIASQFTRFVAAGIAASPKSVRKPRRT